MSVAFTANAKLVDRIVAIVNDECVTLYDMDRAMAPHLASIRRATNPEAKRKEIARVMLDNLINQKLLRQEVAKAKIEVTNDELSHAVANVLQQNGITIDQLQNELVAKGISFDAFKEQLLGEIRQAKFIQENLGSLAQVSSRDIENYKSDRNVVVDSQEQAKLLSIFLSLENNNNDKTVKKMVQKGQKIAQRARAGEDFEKLIRRYSKTSKEASAQNASLQSLSEFPPEVAAWVRETETGAVSDPIVTPQGIYIVKLLEKSAGTQTEAKADRADSQVEAALYQERMDQEIRNYLMRLRKKAFIEVRE